MAKEVEYWGTHCEKFFLQNGKDIIASAMILEKYEGIMSYIVYNWAPEIIIKYDWVPVLCAQHGRNLMGESPQSALVMGKTQLYTKGVHSEVESELSQQNYYPRKSLNILPFLAVQTLCSDNFYILSKKSNPGQRGSALDSFSASVIRAAVIPFSFK